MECIICKNSSLKEYSKKSYFNQPVFYCSDCDLYVSGSSENEIKQISEKLYQDEYWRERKSIDSINSNYEDDFGQYRKNQWSSQVNYCNFLLKNKKTILEIGSGAGIALTSFDKSGFDVLGIEPDRQNVELINKKLQKGKCVPGFLEKISLDQKFDIIWMSHVFEHFIRPDQLLERCKSLLKENGFIFIEVPDCSNLKILKESINENPSTFHFTEKSLKKLSENLGFQIKKCDSLRFYTITERRIKKIQKKYFDFFPFKIYKYYPFFITKKNNGELIRIILSK